MIQPGFAGPPPHVHARLHDRFYILEGSLPASANALI
jgi:uncharacterized cupin superfamily protein